MEINITWNICRVCLKEEQKKPLGVTNEDAMRHLFNDDKLLAKQIFDCTGIKMKLNDGLPEKICKKCLTIVKHSANLRKTCRASDIYLQNLLERTKSASTLFKPQWQTEEDIEDDPLSCSTNDDEDDKQPETLKRKLSPLHKPSKKSCSTKNSEDNEINGNSDNEINSNSQTHDDVDENNLNHIVEEVLDSSESLTDQEQKIKTLNLEDFHVNNDTEFVDTAESDIKYNNEQLYYVVKEELTENASPEQTQEHRDEINQHNLKTDDTEDENVQYVPFEEDENNVDESEIDEEQIIHLAESDIDDNQAQVSSTVDTKEDQVDFNVQMEEEEGEEEEDVEEVQNSNLSTASNELQTEYIVDEYLVDDSSSNISTRSSSIVLLKPKPPNANRAKTILPERKTKPSGQSKAVPSSSVGGMQVWVCDLCGNHFSNRQLLNIHMKIHRQEKNHECELCSKRFITACNLQAHMRIHTGEKPFECQYCGRRFSDRSSHLRHERIHTNEKPFECTICQKAFSLATTLKKHMKVHSSERSYRCDACSKSFKLPHQLKAHKNTTLHKAVEHLGSLEN